MWLGGMTLMPFTLTIIFIHTALPGSNSPMMKVLGSMEMVCRKMTGEGVTQIQSLPCLAAESSRKIQNASSGSVRLEFGVTRIKTLLTEVIRMVLPAIMMTCMPTFCCG